VGRDWPLTFWSVDEPVPGPAWQHLFAVTWPSYRSWYLREGSAARPDLATCQRALAFHMPELLPTWQRLVELAGGDPLVARMLTMYNPPAYLTGCSQAVYRSGPPALVRNYDFAPQLLEGVVRSTAYAGRRVVGMSDCLWGLVDGMNDAGLTASLAFGGRRVVGTGFGVPLVLRYLLEVCDTTASARRTLARLPVHMAYNITVVDRSGEYFTAFVGPDRPPVFLAEPVATNHQTGADWPAQAQATHSLERHAALTSVLGDPGVDLAGLADRFLAPPLYSTGYALGFGTLYTAVYRPVDLAVEYRWPGSSWRHSIPGFTNGEHRVVLAG
jgi:predicted choloylglycine hydrolase